MRSSPTSLTSAPPLLGHMDAIPRRGLAAHPEPSLSPVRAAHPRPPAQRASSPPRQDRGHLPSDSIIATRSAQDPALLADHAETLDALAAWTGIHRDKIGIYGSAMYKQAAARAAPALHVECGGTAAGASSSPRCP
ncbi:hypothetical protein GCM10022416_64000 [Actinomadura keratinilytica]|uniref:Uncharacterized protein n=1 Tax=Actinomadura keratinilytica TaxID=547461 RepID=A0ABP6ULL4_9ACTN